MIGRRATSPQPAVEGPKGFDDFDMRLGDLMRGERATLGKSLLDVQRDLKIKATYIAAIENADISAFEAPGFIAGFVRSYARYLGMDPDHAFAKFCREANFEVAHGMSAAASSSAMVAKRARLQDSTRDPIASPAVAFGPAQQRWTARIEPGALGSFAVLAALVVALGYGGWSVLREVQRVQLAPVDQAPSVVAEIDPLGSVRPVTEVKPEATEQVASVGGVTADPLARVTQPQALAVPVLTSRDGPIAAINPRKAGGLTATDTTIADTVAQVVGDQVQVVADARPGVEVLAVRPSWVQVSAADGTVLFEKILDAGERYAVPPLQDAPVLRSGNSGSVYFLVNGQTFGPAAPGANVVKNVALSVDNLTQSYAAADLSGDAALAEILNVADAGVSPLAAPADGSPIE